MTADVLLHIISRFIHIASVVLLLGGVAYARLTLVDMPDVLQLSALRFRSTLYALLALILLSGFYNYFTYSGPRHTSTYQMWFGFKFLLVLHVLATSILWSTSPGKKAGRRLLSLTISGFVIVAISAYLRSLTQRGY